MVEQTSRDMKKRMGNMAYAMSAFKALFHSREITFHMDIDGKAIRSTGFACIVANSGNVGLANVSLSPVRLDDGILDVFIFRDSSVESFVAAVKNILTHTETHAIQHWSCKEVHIECHPKELVQCDGEIFGKKDVSIAMMAGAAGIVVPKVSAPNTPVAEMADVSS
jgi:diacylglycerol kinase family enzyme